MRERTSSAERPASTANGSTGVCRKRDFFFMRAQLDHKCASPGRGESRHGLRDTEQLATKAQSHRENLKILCVSVSLWRILRVSQPVRRVLTRLLKRVT